MQLKDLKKLSTTYHWQLVGIKVYTEKSATFTFTTFTFDLHLPMYVQPHTPKYVRDIRKVSTVRTKVASYPEVRTDVRIYPEVRTHENRFR